MSTFKTQCVANINALIPKLTDDELEHLYNYIKDILKLPRTSKVLTNDITIYLQVIVSIIDKDNKISGENNDEGKNTKHSNKFINELNYSYRDKIKNYINSNDTIISDLFNIKNNTIKITDEDDVGNVKVNYAGKVESNFLAITLNKPSLNTIEEKFYKTRFEKINELFDNYHKETEENHKHTIYSTLYNIFNSIISKNNLKTPKELKKLEYVPQKINEAISLMKTYTPESFDVRFRRVELYSMKDILETKEDKIYSFDSDNFTFNINFQLKKIS